MSSNIVRAEDKTGYIVDGKAFYPSVTTILQDVLKYYYAPGNAEYRGNVVHSLTEKIDKGEMTINDVLDDTMLPYVQAYENWKRDIDPYIKEVELTLYSPKYGYAGTLDRIVEIESKTYVLDIKTGSKAKHYRLQLAGYSLLYSHVCNVILPRIILYLKDNGKYKMEIYEDDNREDLYTWLSVLKVYKFKNGG